MGWFNSYGLVLMTVILIPNILFAVKCKDGFENLWKNRAVEGLEQIGRFSCFGLMVINIPHTWFGFWHENGLTVYLAVNAVLAAAYCLIWIVCFRRNSVFRALALSILPSLLFLFSGVMIRSVPLILAALLFAPCHILISYKNAFLSTSKYHERKSV
ncbi:MAG: hypothetical protein ACI4PQ_00970 [Butyricicoccaceae bacterium]